MSSALVAVWRDVRTSEGGTQAPGPECGPFIPLGFRGSEQGASGRVHCSLLCWRMYSVELWNQPQTAWPASQRLRKSLSQENEHREVKWNRMEIRLSSQGWWRVLLGFQRLLPEVPSARAEGPPLGTRRVVKRHLKHTVRGDLCSLGNVCLLILEAMCSAPWINFSGDALKVTCWLSNEALIPRNGLGRCDLHKPCWPCHFLRRNIQEDVSTACVFHISVHLAVRWEDHDCQTQARRSKLLLNCTPARIREFPPKSVMAANGIFHLLKSHVLCIRSLTIVSVNTKAFLHLRRGLTSSQKRTRTGTMMW